MEKEIDGKLPFLDLLIHREGESLSFDIYRKPTNTHQFIHSTSNHPWAYKMAGHKTAVHRLKSVPLSPEKFEKERQFLKSVAVSNGFQSKIIDDIIQQKDRPRRTEDPVSNDESQRIVLPYNKHLCKGLHKIFNKYNLKVIFKSINSLRSLLGSPKDPIEEKEKSGVYEIKCGDCEKSYIGQTKRNIKTRFNEHINYYKYNHLGSSGLGNHLINTRHKTKNLQLKLLKEVNKEEHLLYWESLFIQARDERKLLNEDRGKIQFSNLVQLLH